ncbi:MAG: hypothetical protein R3F46_03025 [bacterium]
MTDNADNWSRDISAELEELNAYMRKVVGTLPEADRFFVTRDWRKNYRIVATEARTGIFQTVVSRSELERSIFVYREAGEEPRYSWIPDEVDEISFSSSGTSAFRNGTPLAAFHELMYFATLEADGSLAKQSPRFIDFVLECQGNLETSHIGSLQFPADGIPGLLAMWRWPEIGYPCTSTMSITLFEQSDADYSILQQSILENSDQASVYDCYLVNGHIISSLAGGPQSRDIVLFKLEDFIRTGDLKCVARHPVISDDIAGGRNEKVCGADTEYIYILNYRTGRLRRIKIE